MKSTFLRLFLGSLLVSCGGDVNPEYLESGSSRCSYDHSCHILIVEESFVCQHSNDQEQIDDRSRIQFVRPKNLTIHDIDPEMNCLCIESKCTWSKSESQ